MLFHFFCIRLFVCMALVVSAAFVSASALAVVAAPSLLVPVKGSFVVCAATPSQTKPPADDAPQCKPAQRSDIDPQGRMIWVKVSFDVPPSFLVQNKPLGFLVMGKFARQLWLNGDPLGADGRPGVDKRSELVGPMDSIHYVPRERLTPGRNEVALLTSAHHGVVHLRYPLHRLAFVSYQAPRDEIGRHFTVPIAALGAFVLAAFYFGASAFAGRDRVGSLMLAGMTVLGGMQLLGEVSRGLFAYDYPVHDWRLLALTGFATAFGYGVYLFVARRFLQQLTPVWLAVPLLGAGLIVAIQPGYDAKALFGMAFGVTCALGVAIWFATKNACHARLYATVLALFLVISLLTGGDFLDRYFFLGFAGLLCFLAVQQAIALRDAQSAADEAAHQAAQLEQALATADAGEKRLAIQVKTGRRSESLPVSSIIRFQGAGDYSEVHLVDGRQLLTGMTLAELEKTLPANFLRVHRSHIVKSSEIRGLEREASGAGRIELRRGGSVPVSRRILPKVRAAL